MKKRLRFVLLISIVPMVNSCALLTGHNQQDSSDYVQHSKMVMSRKNHLMIDLCDEGNMPKFTNRPTIDRQKLKTLSVDNDDLDRYIQAYMTSQDNYINQLIDVIIKTRRRVQECR